MKKAAAIFFSVLLYIAGFLLIFRFSLGRDIRWFLLGFPLIAAVYFIGAGAVFSRCLKLSRWCLWLSMNIIGGLCGWIILLVSFPSLLFNGFILLLILAAGVISAVVWAVVGLGFLLVKRLCRPAPSRSEYSCPIPPRKE